MLARMDHAPDGARPDAKRALRAAIRPLWAEADLVAAGAAVTSRLLGLDELESAMTVAAYADLPGELPTGDLLAALAARGMRVLLPVLHDDSSLSWRAAAPGAPYAEGRRGTRHPATGQTVPLSVADVVVAPGLAFDRHGRRLGRGGGSYDRALHGTRPDAALVGVALDETVVDAVPTEPHDVAVHVVVTPTTVLRAASTGC